MSTLNKEIARLEEEILGAKRHLSELRRQNLEEVMDYELQTVDGPKRLSEFFGDKDELVVIHNMGRGCNYCTLWADGFNGLTKQFLSRAGFVLASADSAEKVSETAQRRGWTFPVASNGESAFAKDMGYTDADGNPWPGVSAFTRKDGKIYRHGHASLGEGDDFCSIWHVWDLFPTGFNGWEPR